MFSPLLIATLVGLLVTAGLLAAIPSQFVRGRLRFSAWLLLACLAVSIVISSGVGDPAVLGGIGRLLFVLAVINLVIALLANPWREHRPSDRFPAIVQDVAIIGLFVIVATVLMKEQFLTTSAVGAVVVGFALQDTLGNLFSGLAIQIEKPFRVGHWIAVGDREGQVQEITWRATKLRTKAGQFLVVPNGVISKEPILNYSEPTIPTRLEVEVGASYDAPPNDVKKALREALDNSPLILPAPPADIILHAFDASAITYRVRFWVADYSIDNQARDQVRTNIWYSFRRHNIEIPYPIQVQYERDELPKRSEGDVLAAAASLSGVDLFAGIPEEVRLELSRRAQDKLYCAGEAVVRQGAEGDSMFVVARGRVRVVLEPAGTEVAIIAPGGFFGEMSMLTGEARTATVRAMDDVRLLELRAQDFRQLAMDRPGLVEQISRIVATRRAELDEARSAAANAATAVTAPATLLARIQRFLRLPH